MELLVCESCGGGGVSCDWCETLASFSHQLWFFQGSGNYIIFFSPSELENDHFRFCEPLMDSYGDEMVCSGENQVSLLTESSVQTWGWSMHS